MKDEQLTYGWKDAQESCAHGYLLPSILRSLPAGHGLRILDIGCGNGFISGYLAALGHQVVGVDVSRDGVEIARTRYPKVDFHVASLYDQQFESTVETGYQVAIAVEVIEHLYWPRVLLQRARSALNSGGRLIVSSPYHGYLKNLALSIAGAWDRHFHVTWDGGHIKFFSRASLSSLMTESGFRILEFQGAGRFPWLWKSMVITGEKT